MGRAIFTDKAARKFVASIEGCKPSDVEIETQEHYGLLVYTANGNAYAVGTDSECDDAAGEYISDSLWAFNADFLAPYMPDGVDHDIVAAIQESRYEDASPAFKGMIGDLWDDFVHDAIASDGRGHFLAPYDGVEHEHYRSSAENAYAYRID